MFPLQPPPKQERGQVLVLVALVLVALVGFAGVAIDGGNLYTEQRRAQAAADNAVLAAAFRQMQGMTSTAQLSGVALDNAVLNTYVNNGTDTWVSFYRPPRHGGHAGDSKYMEVMITHTVQTALVHFVYRGPVAVTVFAVAHGESSTPIMAGFAIATFHTTCDADLFTARGGVMSIIKDGGIYVNAPPGCNSINFSGTNARVATTRSTSCPDDSADATCDIDGSFPIQVSGAQTEGGNCSAPPDWWTNPGTNCNFYPAVTTGVPQISQSSYTDFMPVTAADINCGDTQIDPAPNGPSSGTNTLQPGRYTSLVSARALVLMPGIYCVTSSYNGKVLQAPSIEGHGVLIYIQQSSAELKFTGGDLSLSAPFSGENGLNCASTPVNALCNLQGILIFKPNGPDTCSPSATDIEFAGNGNMVIRGLIWAPKSFFTYTGNGNLYMSGQALAACAKYSGNGEMDITYNPEDSFVPPPSVQLDN